MTQTNISPAGLREMLAFTAKRIEAAETDLTALDSAIGDGDHGITMRLGFQAVEKRVGALPEASSISSTLLAAGNEFMGATGGAIGVILGRMLIAAGKALQGAEQIGPQEFRVMLGTMEQEVVKVGRAKPGDKTLLDALHAAVTSVSSAAPSEGLDLLMDRAAAAAKSGAQSTGEMPCRLGRASRLGDRALGHMDPGAVSFSLILAAMADWLQQTA